VLAPLALRAPGTLNAGRGASKTSRRARRRVRRPRLADLLLLSGLHVSSTAKAECMRLGPRSPGDAPSAVYAALRTCPLFEFKRASLPRSATMDRPGSVTFASHFGAAGLARVLALDRIEEFFAFERLGDVAVEPDAGSFSAGLRHVSR